MIDVSEYSIADDGGHNVHSAIEAFTGANGQFNDILDMPNRALALILLDSGDDGPQLMQILPAIAGGMLHESADAARRLAAWATCIVPARLLAVIEPRLAHDVESASQFPRAAQGALMRARTALLERRRNDIELRAALGLHAAATSGDPFVEHIDDHLYGGYMQIIREEAPGIFKSLSSVLSAARSVSGLVIDYAVFATVATAPAPRRELAEQIVDCVRELGPGIGVIRHLLAQPQK